MPLKWELQPAVDHMVYKLSRDEPLIQFPGVFHAALWAVGARSGWSFLTRKCPLMRLGRQPPRVRSG